MADDLALHVHAVFAHVTLISSVPADGAVVATAPQELVLTLNKPVAPLVLKLVRPDGTVVPLDRIMPRDDSLAVCFRRSSPWSPCFLRSPPAIAGA